MSAFIKAKLKNGDRQTNIDKYRLAVHKILQNIILDQKFDLLHLFITVKSRKYRILKFTHLEMLCLLHLT